MVHVSRSDPPYFSTVIQHAKPFHEVSNPVFLNRLPYVLHKCVAINCILVLLVHFRMHPIVGGNIRSIAKDMTLDGYAIPKGVSCSLHCLANFVYSEFLFIHHNLF